MCNIDQITTMIAAVTALIVALGGLITTIMQIRDLRLHINSRMDQMMGMQSEIARAEGAAAERARARNESEGRTDAN